MQWHRPIMAGPAGPSRGPGSESSLQVWRAGPVARESCRRAGHSGCRPRAGGPGPWQPHCGGTAAVPAAAWGLVASGPSTESTARLAAEPQRPLSDSARHRARTFGGHCQWTGHHHGIAGPGRPGQASLAARARSLCGGARLWASQSNLNFKLSNDPQLENLTWTKLTLNAMMPS